MTSRSGSRPACRAGSRCRRRAADRSAGHRGCRRSRSSPCRRAVRRIAGAGRSRGSASACSSARRSRGRDCRPARGPIRSPACRWPARRTVRSHSARADERVAAVERQPPPVERRVVRRRRPAREVDVEVHEELVPDDLRVGHGRDDVGEIRIGPHAVDDGLRFIPRGSWS